MLDSQYKLIVDGARRHGATFPTQADWLDFKASIDAAFGLGSGEARHPPLPEVPPEASPDAPQRTDAPAPAPDSHPAPAEPPAQSDGLPDDYWPMLARIESGNRPFIKAGTSSASGLYQFIKSTWQGEGGKWGGDSAKAFGGLRPSPEEQLARARTFTAKNAAFLRSRGIPINRASLYAAHFLGPVTAAKVIGADVNERADLIAGRAATNANKSILLGKTVGQFLTWLHKKTGAWAR